MSTYTPRYPGERWSIWFGAASQSSFALEELQRCLQNFVPYVIEVHPASAGATPTGNALLLGTPDDHPFLAELTRRGVLQLTHPEGFHLKCIPNPWDASGKLVVLAAQSTQGLLHAVETFCARQLYGEVLPEKLQPERLQAGLDALPDFDLNEAPQTPERGLWSWGYVVHDYRRFLDNMARLKMNLLTLWNDVPPHNFPDILTYAHERGVRIHLGFPWGWGMQYDLADPADRRQIQQSVLQHYRQHIAPLHPDGIYFQTLTEHNTLELGGRSIASFTCELVNQVAGELFHLTPDLDIRFGLHATSIRQHYTALAQLDRRVAITWEDAGALPFSYQPQPSGPGQDAGQTLEYALQLAALRPGTLFAMIAKGWTTLDWPAEFEHHGPYLLGLRSRTFTRRRLEQIAPRWEQVNALWLQHYPLALEFYRRLLPASGGRLSVLGLVEDGLFEEKIQPSVALLAESLWDPQATAETILGRAFSPYYQEIL